MKLLFSAILSIVLATTTVQAQTIDIGTALATAEEKADGLLDLATKTALELKTEASRDLYCSDRDYQNAAVVAAATGFSLGLLTAALAPVMVETAEGRVVYENGLGFKAFTDSRFLLSVTLPTVVMGTVLYGAVFFVGYYAVDQALCLRVDLDTKK